MEGVFQQCKASLEERGSFSVLKKETLSDCALFKSLEEQYKDNCWSCSTGKSIWLINDVGSDPKLSFRTL